MSKEQLVFDLADLTMGDIIDFEEYGKHPLSILASGQPIPGTVATAMWWIIKRRENPKLKWSDALKVKLVSYEIELENSDGDAVEAAKGSPLPDAE